jgi:hypothetical protein
MNSKGQFSIIAALFVAVILIATVIMTYSTIRNSPIQEQPQVLSAIDETNLALKQILGFTVGYYGSVLQVTGNSSYAKMLARNYLHSGLVNIANMHPDWGTSFNVSYSDMSTYWFTNASYSIGNLSVNYSLTGLGMYGITYETSCRLMVQVENTTSSSQTQLIVTKDEGEPLINLGKQNFKFYRYVYASSIWELVNPSSEPVAFANGTYQIEIPSGIDPYSYVIQVEDSRGIVVVASSFSRYTCTFSWNTQSPTKYAVTGSSSAITGVPDGNYATIGKGATCEVTDYQDGTGIIKQVYFNITYYGSGTGTLEWYYQLDGGVWNKIEDLLEGGSAASPLTRTYNATSLRATWTWDNLNTTHIRFRNNLNNDDAYVEAIFVTVVATVAGNYSTIPNETLVVELLQNGTMRWLGQNLELTTQAKPIPPVPVKAIHVNQTIAGIDYEVPFQIEDWASDYRIPLGLTNNASVFNSRTMLVFLANSKVSKVTIWWEGSDTTNQTSYAYTNRYFTGDDPNNGLLTNGMMNLTIITSSSRFQIKSAIGTVESTARFMRINNEWSIYGAAPAYVIHHGIVRDIIHQEAEWSDGADNCPNLYAHIIVTFPANATYYTYHLRLMFIESQQKRNITDLCPIKLTTSSITQLQTENGTANGYPVVSSGTGLFYNFSSIWAHHWSQINISATSGTGIMFTDSANQMLYFFDGIAGNKTGALRVNSTSRTIELLPVAAAPANFTYALDISWHGAVVTFDGTTPIYKEESGQKTGLWIIVEYPPTITVTTES